MLDIALRPSKGRCLFLQIYKYFISSSKLNECLFSVILSLRPCISKTHAVENFTHAWPYLDLSPTSKAVQANTFVIFVCLTMHVFYRVRSLPWHSIKAPRVGWPWPEWAWSKASPKESAGWSPGKLNVTYHSAKSLGTSSQLRRKKALVSCVLSGWFCDLSFRIGNRAAIWRIWAGSSRAQLWSLL